MTIQKTTFIKAAKKLGIIVLISLAINSWWIITEWYAVSSFSTQEIAWIGLSLAWFLFLPLLFAPFVFLGSLIGVIFKKSRNTSALIVTFSLAFLITGIFSMSISGNIRHNAFVKLANNSSELIKAIKDYETQHGTAPESLRELVPDFLPSVPTTGIGAYPEYQYQRWCGKDCYDNPWYLQVQSSPGGINFDSFVYLPKQNYPEKGYGGTLERIEDWAYVHE